MSILGIITEYNPLHNGHLYHLHKSRLLCGADYVVAVMSGNFIQRGEPALVNKWARAEMAVRSGVDLVIELPVVYSMSSAEFFAFGAVKILDSLGIVDYLCFGSESGRLDELEYIADVLVTEPESYRSPLKNGLEKGLSFPASREKALLAHFSKKDIDKSKFREVMRSSNNILGIEYLKAIKRLDSKIKPVTIQRVSNRYNDRKMTGIISSASSIRESISSGFNPCKNLPCLPVPDIVNEILEREFNLGKGPLFIKNYENILLSIIRIMSLDQMKTYPFISEGLENRIKQAAFASGSLEEMVGIINTKRYTRTRIQRTLLNFLTGLKEYEFRQFNESGGPQYARVLGFNSKGRTLLSKMKKTCSIPVIVKTASFKNSSDFLVRRMLEIEAAATDIYVLGYDNQDFKKGGQEFTNNAVIISR